MRPTKQLQKNVSTHTMDKIKKGFRPFDRQTRKNLHTATSVNKPKLSVNFNNWMGLGQKSVIQCTKFIDKIAMVQGMKPVR